MIKIKNKKTILLTAALFFMSIFACQTILAETVELYSNQQIIPGAPARTCDISTYIQQIIGFGYATIGILTLFMLGVGAYQYIMSVGNTARMTSAKNTVNYAILGLVLGLLSWIILYTINPNLVKVQLGETVPCTIQWTTSGTGTTVIETISGKYDAVSLNKNVKDRVNSYSDIIKAAHEKYPNVSEALIKALIDQESGGIYDAVSSKGAMGLMQLMEGTAGNIDRKDPYQNIMTGTKYFSGLLNRYNGNVENALSAYNWGEGNMDAYLKTGRGKKGQSMPLETQRFAPSVLRKAESYKIQ